VLAECARSLGAALVSPLRTAASIARHGALVAGVRSDLASVAAPDDPGPQSPARDRPLRAFVSCAEPSGESHALGLVDALRSELADAGAPAPELVGLGGERLAAAGVRTLGDPVARAAMGADALRSVPFYFGLLEEAARELRERPFDVVVPVDSPALHVPLGHIARRYGAPVVHHVTPQYWAWAPWRVGGYRRAVDLALTILPFEPSWFARHGVRARHVGHPHLDALATLPRAAESEREPLLVLLPGSRESVVRRNLPWMLAAAGRLRLARPSLSVALPHGREELAPLITDLVARAGASSWVRLELGRLHETLGRARLALSVSGTVLVDLLHQRVPTVVVYRLKSAWSARFAGRVLTTPWFSSVNLLAGRELLPEFAFAGVGPLEEVAGALASLADDGPARRETLAGLEEAARRLGPAGASRRAARHVLAEAASRAPDGPRAPHVEPGCERADGPGCSPGGGPGHREGSSDG